MIPGCIAIALFFITGLAYIFTRRDNKELEAELVRVNEIAQLYFELASCKMCRRRFKSTLSCRPLGEYKCIEYRKQFQQEQQ